MVSEAPATVIKRRPRGLGVEANIVKTSFALILTWANQLIYGIRRQNRLKKVRFLLFYAHSEPVIGN